MIIKETVNKMFDEIITCICLKRDKQSRFYAFFQLTIAINFISSKKNSDETRTMHAPSDNIEIMMSSETNEIIEELSESLLQKYQEGLQESMDGSHFTSDSVDVLYYNLNKISLNRGGLYIDSPKWLKNKKTILHKSHIKTHSR